MCVGVAVAAPGDSATGAASVRPPVSPGTTRRTTIVRIASTASTTRAKVCPFLLRIHSRMFTLPTDRASA